MDSTNQFFYMKNEAKTIFLAWLRISATLELKKNGCCKELNKIYTKVFSTE